MDEDERRTRDLLMVVDAMAKALDRRDEVLRLVEDSENSDEAIRRVGQLLGVGELGGRVVLDLQVRRFTRDQRRSVTLHAEELRSQLPDGG